MKKLLRGVNIAVAVLLIALNVALIIYCERTIERLGGLWGWSDEGYALMDQDQIRDRLNEDFPFAPSVGSEPAVLSPERLEAWLRVIAAMRDPYARVERTLAARAQLLDRLDAPEDWWVLEVLEVLIVTQELRGELAQVRGELLEALRKQRMSPREYVAISTAVSGFLENGAGSPNDPAPPPPDQAAILAAQRARLEHPPVVARLLDREIKDLVNALASAH